MCCPNVALRMLIRSVTSQFHRGLLTAALLLGPALAQSEQTLTLNQGRVLAVEALRVGKPDLTLQVAKGLLQADPRDAGTHFLIANAFAQRRRHGQARRAAARAYRFSDDTLDKFQAAQMAAKQSFDDNRHMLAQIWLRRTVIHAPNAKVEELVARDYRAVRAQNPWFLRIRSDVTPSNNVNNGADTALQIIDGVPVTGTLNGAAQALSGIIATTDIQTSYRLHGDASRVTSLGGRLYVQRVALSSEAQAPWLRNSDFNSTYAEMSLRHAFAIGAPNTGNSASVDVAYGTSSYAADRSYDFVRFGGERRWVLGGKKVLRLSVLVENRHNARYRSNDAQIFGLGAQFTQPLPNGDQVHLSLALRDSNAKSPNGTYQSASLRTSYDFGRPIGPMRLSAGLVLGYSDYPVFNSGLFYAPGGRQDHSMLICVEN